MDTTLLFSSEIALSLYPQLIKLIPANVETQVSIRLIVYSISAIIYLFLSHLTSITTIRHLTITIKSLINTTALLKTVWLGIVNIVHIFVSYIAFATLTSGTSYTLFYMYPIFNVLARNLIWGESTNFTSFVNLVVALVGVYLITSSQINYLDLITSPDTLANKLPTSLQYLISKFQLCENTKIVGVICGILSALTETIIYLTVKSDIASISPFVQLLRTYLLGGIISLAMIIGNKIPEIRILKSEYIVMIILFNLVIGFLGYVLRFYIIPRLSTLKFNSLIFIGVTFSYIWGYIFGKEVINFKAILGSLCIIGAIFMN